MDMQDFANDPDLEKLYEQRMALYRRQLEEKQRMSLKGHGQLTEVTTGPPVPRRSHPLGRMRLFPARGPGVLAPPASAPWS